MLWFYLRKLIMEHSTTLHKMWTWGVYQVLGNGNKRINPRGGAEKSQKTWSLPAGKKLKWMKGPGKRIEAILRFLVFILCFCSLGCP
jgi:hypothetical protein